MTEHNHQNGKPEEGMDHQEPLAEDTHQEESQKEQDDLDLSELLENPIYREMLFKAYRRIEREIQKRKDLKLSK